MRRKPGSILPIEVAILDALEELKRHGVEEAHGFLLAKQMQVASGAHMLTGYGTLYRALDRMRAAGWLTSRWEEPEIAQAEGRPPRRLYMVTPEGVRARQKAPRAETKRWRLLPGWTSMARGATGVGMLLRRGSHA